MGYRWTRIPVIFDVCLRLEKSISCDDVMCRNSDKSLHATAITLQTWILFVFYADLKKQYFSKPRIPGVCYATSSVAIGKFDQRGGTLRFENCNSIQLVIPAGALQILQLVYLAVTYEDRDISDETPTLSPVFDCGPDGLHFEVYIQCICFLTLNTWNKMCLTGWLTYNFLLIDI